MVAPSDHQIQWSQLRGPTRRRSPIHPRRTPADSRHHSLLHDQCRHAAPRALPSRYGTLRRYRRPIYMGQDTPRHVILAIFQHPARTLPYRRHTRRGIRPVRRRLSAPYGILIASGNTRSRRENHPSILIYQKNSITNHSYPHLPCHR